MHSKAENRRRSIPEMVLLLRFLFRSGSFCPPILVWCAVATVAVAVAADEDDGCGNVGAERLGDICYFKRRRAGVTHVCGAPSGTGRLIYEREQ